MSLNLKTFQGERLFLLAFTVVLETGKSLAHRLSTMLFAQLIFLGGHILFGHAFYVQLGQSSLYKIVNNIKVLKIRK